MRLRILISVSFVATLVALVTLFSRLPKECDFARNPIRNATEIELLSLDPHQRLTDAPDRFHGWKVLGTTSFKDSRVRDELLDSLLSAVKNHDETAAQCFNPRHGIRADVGGHVYEFLICFECFQGKWYIDDRQQIGFILNADPLALFNSYLVRNNVAIPDK